MNELPAKALAPAKINLGLFVGPPREDGRHELVSVMQSISLADELTLELAEGGGEAVADQVVCPGVGGAADDNLAARALAAFRQATGWDAPPLRLSIDKRIPVAAGLGGGSADAAAALRLAVYASGLGDHALLLRLAALLGADVPAQIAPGRRLARGAGEVLEALPPPNPSFAALVLPVAAQLSTAAVYAELDRQRLDPHQGSHQPRDSRRPDHPRSPRDPKFMHETHHALRRALDFGAQAPPPELLANDLQAPALALCPEIAAALAQARDSGADHAFVSGSGPTVVALFLRANGLVRAQRAAAGLEDRTPPPVIAIPVAADFGRAERCSAGPAPPCGGPAPGP